MRAFSKTFSAIAILATVALTASAADARSVNTNRLGGAYNSVATPAPGSVTYDAEGSPFPSGHGGTSGSSDFQLMR
jgi:hypothetical protein